MSKVTMSHGEHNVVVFIMIAIVLFAALRMLSIYITTKSKKVNVQSDAGIILDWIAIAVFSGSLIYGFVWMYQTY